MKFVDRAKIFVQSGNGGNGCISFRRERCVPEGGPDGGDGGRGGNIVFLVDENKSTLIDFTHTVHLKAKHGENGGSARCFGKSADDLIIHIPKGTQIWNEDKNIMFFDATEHEKTFILCQGGKGGIGNAKFATSTNQTPRFAIKGDSGQELWIWLVLKLFADIGYIGFPNAGKSSLLQILTGSKTKIGDYPFTTLNPELGALIGANKRLIMADLPGIIQGAHENRGLGLKFLGHIERCKGILHVIDVANMNAADALSAMLYEIEQFSPALLKKKQIIALNKIDMVAQSDIKEQINQLNKICNFEIFPISCLERLGLSALTEALFSMAQL